MASAQGRPVFEGAGQDLMAPSGANMHKFTKLDLSRRRSFSMLFGPLKVGELPKVHTFLTNVSSPILI